MILRLKLPVPPIKSLKKVLVSFPMRQSTKDSTSNLKMLERGPRTL